MTPKPWLLFGLTMAAILLAACGSNGYDDTTPATAVNCDRLASESYRWSAHWQQSVDELAGSPSPNVQEQIPYTFTGDIEGNVEDGTGIDVSYSNTDGSSSGDVQAIRMDNGLAYLDVGTGFNELNTAVRPIAIPFEPSVVCQSFAPDLDLSELGSGTPDPVNGIEGLRYDFEDLPTLYFARSPMFGAASDVARYASEWDGSVWVANAGGYISKFDVTAERPFESGQYIRFEATFEVYDMGEDVSVSRPADFDG